MPSMYEPWTLDEYLDIAVRPLWGAPEALRRDYREEFRLHLLELAAERQLTGADPETAMAGAMKAFGDPRKVGRNVANQLGWSGGLMPGNPWLAMGTYFVWLKAISLISGLIFKYFATDIGLAGVVNVNTTFMRVFMYGSMLIFVFVIPLVGGWMTALVAPRWAIRGVAVANLAWLCLYSPEIVARIHGANNTTYLVIIVVRIVIGCVVAGLVSLRIRGLSLFPPTWFGKGQRA